jgi:hypothetical protein
MNKDGFWINYRTDEVFEIHEHEKWIREGNNAKTAGVPSSVIKQFSKFKPVDDRDEFLLFIMSKSDLMRVRGHKTYYTFEFSSHRISDPIMAIWSFGTDHLRPLSGMYIVNFASKQSVELYWKDFKEKIDTGRDDSILREDSKFEDVFDNTVKDFKMSDKFVDKFERLFDHDVSLVRNLNEMKVESGRFTLPTFEPREQ